MDRSPFLRYVILRHDPPAGSGEHVHWDLMLDNGTTLWTWSMEAMPETGKPVAAQRIADHRRVYLDYEGPVSRNRGTVVRQESGQYTILNDQETSLQVQMKSPNRSGVLQLTRDGNEPTRWLAVFQSDHSGTRQEC